ncbi:MAG: hypothetical protein JWP91_1206 [Fibrobacteres bacterium]|nr:hypothetical protein [Fibrobacterota bacterium]
MNSIRILSSALFPILAALALLSCSRHHEPELSGAGFVHYHPYPDVGPCYCSGAYDFGAHGMMVAAASPSIHTHFGEKLCERRKYAWLTSRGTGKQVRVLIVDKGGQPTDDFNRSEQHIMDISIEAFKELDPDGAGMHSGRIYVDWEIDPAD